MAAGSDNAITDDVIRRRLLIDGDGMGDDRKLKNMLTTYLTFLHCDGTPEERQIALSRVTAQLQQMKSMVKRTSESIKTNQKATEMYEDLGTKVRFETEETKQQILESKALLEEATKHRKHSMEYDALAKLIGSKPDRKLTELKREKLQEELKRLRERKEKLDEKLENRKRSVSMLSGTIELLNEQLNMSEESGKTPKDSAGQRHHGLSNDLESTSQSGTSTPMDTLSSSQDLAPKHADTANANGSGASAQTNAVEKSKSERYEDLSESDVDVEENP